MYKTKLVGKTETQTAPNNNDGILQHDNMQQMLYH